MTWIYRAFGTWYVAGMVEGALILLAERLSRRAEPSDADVRRAAERYRQWYGERASAVVGDHMLGARFAPDGRHSRFLKRVAGELQMGAGSAEPEWFLCHDSNSEADGEPSVPS